MGNRRSTPDSEVTASDLCLVKREARKASPEHMFLHLAGAAAGDVPPRSIEGLRAMLQEHPDDRVIIRELAKELRQRGRMGEAAAALRRLPEPTIGEIMLIGADLIARQRPGEAAHLLTPLLEAQPDHHTVRLQLVQAQLAGKDYDRAVRTLSPLLQDENMSTLAYAGMAQAWLEQDRPAQVLEMVGSANEKPLKAIAAVAALAEGIRTDDETQREAALRSLGQAKWHFGEGALYARLDAYNDKDAPFGQLVRVSELSFPNAVRLGESLVAVGRLEEAVTLYDQFDMKSVKPSHGGQRKELIRGLESAGDAYLAYATQQRRQLGELTVSVPTPAAQWQRRAQRSMHAEVADVYLDKAFERLFAAYGLQPTSIAVRQKLAQVVELTGNPEQVQELQKRLARREKEAPLLPPSRQRPDRERAEPAEQLRDQARADARYATERSNYRSSPARRGGGYQGPRG